MSEADKSRSRGVRGTVTLKGGWTREALDAFRPVWKSWRFSDAWGSLAGRPFGPEDRSWTFRGYFYEEFHLALSHLDGWTREWIGRHPADTDHPLTAQEYERFLALAHTLGYRSRSPAWSGGRRWGVWSAMDRGCARCGRGSGRTTPSAGACTPGAERGNPSRRA